MLVLVTNKLHMWEEARSDSWPPIHYAFALYLSRPPNLLHSCAHCLITGIASNGSDCSQEVRSLYLPDCLVVDIP